MADAFIFLFPIFFSIVGAMTFSIDAVGKKNNTSMTTLLADLVVHSFSGSIIGSLLLINGVILPLCCICSALAGFFGRQMLDILRKTLIFLTLKSLNVTQKELTEIDDTKK